MATAGADDNCSSGESDWGEDEFPLSTIQVLDRLERENLENSGSSSESENEGNVGENSDNCDDGGQGNITNGGRRWVPCPKNFAKTPGIPAFDDSSTGIQGDKIELVTLGDYFRTFFTRFFLQMIVNATNAYAHRERTKNPDSHKNKWSDVDIPTLVKFIALTMIMGIVRKARLKDYWSRLECIATPFFSNIMKRDRFTSILRYVNYPETEPDPNDEPQPNPGSVFRVKDDPKKKMAWLFNFFNDVAKTVWKPSKNLSIDESMVAHKGRSIHRQYMPAKRTKWGLKVWVCAESLTVGYTMDTMYFAWLDSPVDVDKGTRLPFHTLSDVILYDCSQNYTAGAFPCLEVRFVLRKDFAPSFYKDTVYLISTMLVMITWFSFWIPPSEIRIFIELGCAGVLSVFYLMASSWSFKPETHHRQSWLAFCMSLVLAILLVNLILFMHKGYFIAKFHKLRGRKWTAPAAKMEASRCKEVAEIVFSVIIFPITFIIGVILFSLMN